MSQPQPMHIAKVEAGEYGSINIYDEFGQRWTYMQNKGGLLTLGQILNYPNAKAPHMRVVLFIPIGPNPPAGIMVLEILGD